MLDLLDILLLSRGTPADDRTLAFRRIDGSPASNVIYFLPWFTPFWFARRAGFAPLDFLAAYEMPPAIVGLSVGTYPATYLANRIGARTFVRLHRPIARIWRSGKAQRPAS